MNIRFKFQAMVTRLHSPRTYSRPRGDTTEAERCFDDAEHWLRRLFAQDAERTAPRRLQPMRHRLDRRRLLEPFAQRRMMRLSAHRDDRLDTGLLASLYVARAEIAGVGQQMTLPKASGNAPPRALRPGGSPASVRPGSCRWASGPRRSPPPAGCPPPPPPAQLANLIP